MYLLKSNKGFWNFIPSIIGAVSGIKNLFSKKSTPTPTDTGVTDPNDSDNKNPSMFKTVATDILSSGGSAVVNNLIGKLFAQKQKTMSAKEQADFTKEYLDNAFPGTTPWEQLGNQGNIASSANENQSNIKLQKYLAERNISSQQSIADKANNAQKEIARRHALASAVASGPEAVQAIQDAIDNKPVSKFKTTSQINTEASSPVYNTKTMVGGLFSHLNKPAGPKGFEDRNMAQLYRDSAIKMLRDDAHSLLLKDPFRKYSIGAYTKMKSLLQKVFNDNNDRLNSKQPSNNSGVIYKNRSSIINKLKSSPVSLTK